MGTGLSTTLSIGLITILDTALGIGLNTSLGIDLDIGMDIGVCFGISLGICSEVLAYAGFLSNVCSSRALVSNFDANEYKSNL